MTSEQPQIQYRSSFSKADMRRLLEFPGGRAYRNVNDARVVELNDIFLDPGAATRLAFAENTVHILFPIVGSLALGANNLLLAPEELHFHSSDRALEQHVANPYSDEVINFLHICIRDRRNRTLVSETRPIGLGVKNRLVTTECGNQKVHVGIYDSRIKDRLRLDAATDGVSAFVINGSFDFEERLMEFRDSLFQWDLQEIEFEALSEAAIIVIIECSQ